VEECGLYIILLEVPVKGCSKVHDNLERLEVGGRGSCLIVVNAILLHVPFCDVANLIVDHLASVIMLPFAN